jgi:hypothetical protein
MYNGKLHNLRSWLNIVKREIGLRKGDDKRVQDV